MVEIKIFTKYEGAWSDADELLLLASWRYVGQSSTPALSPSGESDAAPCSIRSVGTFSSAVGGRPAAIAWNPCIWDSM